MTAEIATPVLSTHAPAGATIMAALRMLTPSERWRAVAQAFAIALTEFAQLVSMVLVLPVVSVIVEPDMLEKNQRIAELYAWLGRPPLDGFVLTLAIASLVFLVAGHLGTFAANAWNERFIERLQARMTRHVMAACVHAPYPWFLQRNAAALTRTIHNDITYWARDLVGNGLRIFSFTLSVVSTAALVVVITPMGGLAMLLMAVVLAGVATRGIKNPMIRLNRAKRLASEQSMVMATQMLTGIKDVQANRGQAHFLELFHEAVLRQMRASAKALIYGQIPATAIMLIMQAGVLVVMIALWAAGSTGGEVAAQMALIVLAAARITPAVIRLQGVATKTLNALPWVEGVIALLRSARDARREALSQRVKGAVPEAWTTIAFDRVEFIYEGGARPALHGVDFAIGRGQCVGLIGPSGSGKSTCIDILLDLLQPTAGAVRVDGTPLAEIDQNAWCERIGYVPQQPFFTDDTIAANIAFGLPYDEGRATEAARRAGLGTLIADLPRGLATPLGDRGLRVSGGQRQRIAIARALYRQAEILVLDEATASLDAENEAVIVETMNQLKGEVTILVVSHRMSTLTGCDRIVELEGGRVVAHDAPPPERTAIHG